MAIADALGDDATNGAGRAAAVAPMPHKPTTLPTVDDAYGLLLRCGLFASVDPGVLRTFTSDRYRDEAGEHDRVLEWLCVPGGDTLIGSEEGAAGVYLVLHGRLRVTHKSDAKVTFVQEARVGDVIGAGALLHPDGRRFTALALQDSEVALLPRDVFVEMTRCDPTLWQGLAGVLGGESSAVLRAPAAAARTRHIAVLPGAGFEPIRDRFVVDLMRALQKSPLGRRKVLRLDRDDFDEKIGKGSADNAIGEWDDADRQILAKVEGLASRHDIIVFVADPAYEVWTQRCIRQSESVLIVAHANAPATTTPMEKVLLDSMAEHNDYRLVLLHPRDEKKDPEGTPEWLNRRYGIKRVHHVRIDQHPHYERLARHLTGTAVGLVLGGGGARGQAHLGVVKALRDCDVHIDAVGGTSAGGGIAALTTYENDGANADKEFAPAIAKVAKARAAARRRGDDDGGEQRAEPTPWWDFDVAKEVVRHAFVDLAPFAAFSLPFHSLMQKDAVERPAKYLSGKRWIEDLWLPFFCVSCNIGVGGGRMIHERGRLWRALCATTALPGVLPPVVMNGKILVDGGVVDNVPIGPMRDRMAGLVIAVDVGAAHSELIGKKVLDLPVNMTVILSHLHPLLEPITVPSLLTVVTSTMVLADSVRLHQGADVTIRPDVSGFGMTDFEAQEELVALGYNSTLDRLRDRDPKTGLSDETRALLGINDEKLRALKPLTPLPGPKQARERRIRLRRAFGRGFLVLVPALAVARVVDHPSATTIAVVVALLVPVVVLLQPIPALVKRKAGEWRSALRDHRASREGGAR